LLSFIFLPADLLSSRLRSSPIKSTIICGWVLSQARKIDSDISPSPSHNFYVGEKCEIWPRNFTPASRLWVALVSKRRKNQATLCDSKRILGESMIGLYRSAWEILSHLGPLKNGRENCWIRNNSASRCLLSMKFGRLVHYGSAEAKGRLKSTSGQIQDGGRRRNCIFVNRYNSPADCPILLKSGTWMDTRLEGSWLKPITTGWMSVLKWKCIVNATFFQFVLFR